MANKTSKTLRLSDDVIQMIDQQDGETFTERFEKLVTLCVWELPQKQKQLKQYQEKIKREQKLLAKLSQQVYEYQQIVRRLDGQLGTLAKLIDASTKERTA